MTTTYQDVLDAERALSQAQQRLRTTKKHRDKIAVTSARNALSRVRRHYLGQIVTDLVERVQEHAASGSLMTPDDLVDVDDDLWAPMDLEEVVKSLQHTHVVTNYSGQRIPGTVTDATAYHEAGMYDSARRAINRYLFDQVAARVKIPREVLQHGAITWFIDTHEADASIPYLIDPDPQRHRRFHLKNESTGDVLASVDVSTCWDHLDTETNHVGGFIVTEVRK